LSADQVSPRRQRLSSTLKALRQEAGLSGERLAANLGWSQSKVSKIENGRTRPSREDVRLWLDQVKVSKDLRNELLELADAVQTEATTWRTLYREGFDRRQRYYADLEASAASIQIYQPSVVPGLFQTAEYARRVLTMLGGLDASEIGAAVTARLDRQSVLYDETKTVDCVITEAALRWRPGPVSLWLAQLDRLESLRTLPNVHIGLVPMDSEGAEIPLNQFVIFKLEDGTNVVTVETYTAEVAISEPEGVAAYEQIFKRHQANAVYEGQAGELLTRMRNDRRARP